MENTVVAQACSYDVTKKSRIHPQLDEQSLLSKIRTVWGLGFRASGFRASCQDDGFPEDARFLSFAECTDAFYMFGAFCRISSKPEATCSPRLYRFEDEDDYPYFPRKLGACDVGFNFETGGVVGGIFS